MKTGLSNAVRQPTNMIFLKLVQFDNNYVCELPSCLVLFFFSTGNNQDFYRISHSKVHVIVSFKDFGFIKRLRQRRPSFRPPLKVDKVCKILTYHLIECGYQFPQKENH